MSKSFYTHFVGHTVVYTISNVWTLDGAALMYDLIPGMPAVWMPTELRCSRVFLVTGHFNALFDGSVWYGSLCLTALFSTDIREGRWCIVACTDTSVHNVQIIIGMEPLSTVRAFICYQHDSFVVDQRDGERRCDGKHTAVTRVG